MESLRVLLNGKPIANATFAKLPPTVRESFGSLYSANPCNLDAKGLPETLGFVHTAIKFANTVTKGDVKKLSTLIIRVERADSDKDYREYTVDSLTKFSSFLESFRFGKSPRVVVNTTANKGEDIEAVYQAIEL
jgi:hypothetical protein